MYHGDVLKKLRKSTNTYDHHWDVGHDGEDDGDLVCTYFGCLLVDYDRLKIQQAKIV